MRSSTVSSGAASVLRTVRVTSESARCPHLASRPVCSACTCGTSAVVHEDAASCGCTADAAGCKLAAGVSDPAAAGSSTMAAAGSGSSPTLTAASRSLRRAFFAAFFSRAAAVISALTFSSCSSAVSRVTAQLTTNHSRHETMRPPYLAGGRQFLGSTTIPTQRGMQQDRDVCTVHGSGLRPVIQLAQEQLAAAGKCSAATTTPQTSSMALTFSSASAAAAAAASRRASSSAARTASLGSTHGSRRAMRFTM